MPTPKVFSVAAYYDRSLRYARGKRLPEDAPRPKPTSFWPQENIQLLERFRNWLIEGGNSEQVTNIYHLNMAGHVFGFNLKPHSELDLEKDLDCALEYVKSKQLGASWIMKCRLSLQKFRRYMRLERGLGEESNITPFDVTRVGEGLPPWVVSELSRYQRLMQRNWRDARVEENIRRFWSGHLRMWHFFVEQRNVHEFKELKRQHVLDYVDHRLGEGYSATGVNNDLRNFHTFLLFLQQEGCNVPYSLLRIPALKQADPLPRYLTDEQVKKLREEVEKNVQEATLARHRRLALLVRAAFYLLWQGGMRTSEVEELRLEDLDFPQKRLSVRDGKGRKDRTVYLTDTAIHAVQEFIKVRGEGSGDHVFLYRNAPLKRDLIRDRLKRAGRNIGVKVFPHRLRHTCATQLLNAGCRVTSIQRFLGHKELSSTMIYARAHDQTVAEDYFAAMERVEQRLDTSTLLSASIVPAEQKDIEVVKVQEPEKLIQLIEQLEMPELCFEERLGITLQLRELFGVVQELEPTLVFA
jgi:site-specific recombinase XerD